MKNRRRLTPPVCTLLVLLATVGAAGGAVRNLSGFTANALPRTDDGSSPAVPIGFSLNFFGRTRTSLFVNNNGNITFDTALDAFTPFGLASTRQEIIAVFFADVDTTNERSGVVTYGRDNVGGRQAFGVNYFNVGYFSSGVDKLNTFQLILIDRADTGAGNFDIEFNYDRIQWEAGDASGGTAGLGGSSARVGYSNGSGQPGTFSELPGSGVNGAFLDTARTGLSHNSLNSGVAGRYIFQVRSGTVQPSILSLAPNGASAGDPGFTLTVAGTGFASGSQVRWNNTTLPTMFVSATELRATVAAALLSAPGTASVQVVNPDNVFSNSVIFVISPLSGVVLTRTGLTFRAVQGGGRPSRRSFRILNGSRNVLNFSITTSTLSGGSGWLAVSQGSGTIDPGRPGPLIDVVINADGLAPGDYYGQVQVDAPGAPDSPQFLSVVLSVLSANVNPGPVVEPTGLVFVGLLGGSNPAAKSVRITNLTSRTTSFTAVASFGGSNRWFTHTPETGAVAPNQPVNVQVQPNVSGLPAGIYRGTLVLTFPQDNATRRIDLLLVVTPVVSSAAARPASLAEGPAQTACTPSSLLPVFTLLGASFNAPAAWPTPIEAVVVDNCGSIMQTGSVTATFSSGDPPVPLTPDLEGAWSGTWAPRNARTPSVQVTVTARQPARQLEGIAEVGGIVEANPDVPIVNVNGVISAASFSPAAVPSPGELVSVFGANLADGQGVAGQLPLPAQLQGALLSLGGRPLRLLFTSANQINAVIPYDIPVGARHQLIARRGNRLSVPEAVMVAAAQPAIFSVDLTGRGQGHIYVVPSATEQILASPAAPARAGEVLVMYAAGLGTVQPAVEAGTAAPSSPLGRTVNTVSVTIGGVSAEVLFAGLTPGFSGLYQINAVVPAGVAAGDEVAVVVTVAGIQSPPVTIAVR